MKNDVKYLDIVIMFLFVLWAAATDFSNMQIKDWLAGTILIAYMIYYAVRMGRQKSQQPPRSRKHRSR